MEGSKILSANITGSRKSKLLLVKNTRLSKAIRLRERTSFLAKSILVFLSRLFGSKYELSCVKSFDDYCESFKLVYKEYRKRNYCPVFKSKMHYSEFSFLEDTHTFIMKKDSKLAGTLSIIPDSKEGIPMEKTFPKLIKNMRSEGSKFAEVSLMSLNLKMFKKKRYAFKCLSKMDALLNLFRAVHNFAVIREEITDILICVHPKHADLYKKIGFEVIGDVLDHSSAENNPALPLRLSRQAFLTNRSLKIFDLIFSARALKAKDLKEHYRLSHSEILRLNALDGRELHTNPQTSKWVEAVVKRSSEAIRIKTTRSTRNSAAL